MAKNAEKVVEKVEEVAEKVGFFKRTWKYVVTGVTCAAVGVGVTLGADAARVQDTLTKAQVRQVALSAAAYSAEQVLGKVAAIATADKKVAAVKDAVAETEKALPKMIEAATEVKEAVKDAKADVTAVKTEVKAEVKKAETEVKAEEKKVEAEVKAVTTPATEPKVETPAVK